MLIGIRTTQKMKNYPSMVQFIVQAFWASFIHSTDENSVCASAEIELNGEKVLLVNSTRSKAFL